MSLSVPSLARYEIPKLALTWKSREADLKAVQRYHRIKLMFYRTNLFLHTKRVRYFFSDEIAPLAKEWYPAIDLKEIEVRAEHHDDHELQPLGDVPLQYKLMMSPEELSVLHQEEVLAAEMMARIYPKKVEG